MSYTADMDAGRRHSDSELDGLALKLVADAVRRLTVRITRDDTPGLADSDIEYVNERIRRVHTGIVDAADTHDAVNGTDTAAFAARVQCVFCHGTGLAPGGNPRNRCGFC